MPLTMKNLIPSKLSYQSTIKIPFSNFRMRQIVLIIAQLVFAASLGFSFVNGPAMTAQTTGKVTSFETDTNNPYVLQKGMPTTNMDMHARDGWLNVMDMGATGSVFETTATATKGSNQIIVADAGDFRLGQDITITRCNCCNPDQDRNLQFF